MSEFIQTMDNWRRMCDNYFDAKEWVCSEECPMRTYSICSKPKETYPAPLDFDLMTTSLFERIISKWATENPAPKYPTWYDYISDQMTAPWPCDDHEFVRWLDEHDVPEAIAKKLGLEPINKEKQKDDKTRSD